MLHIEPLTGGLVTARDPSLLSPGELVQASEGLYRPYNAALSPIKGRATFGNTIGANITGLRAIPFEADTATTRLAIATGTVWQYGTGGAWTTFRSGVTTGRRLEAIALGNIYFLSNGASEGPVTWDGTTLRSHGMVPTEANDAIRTITATTGGDWSAVGIGFYSWWFTEYDSVRDIESTSADPITVLAIVTEDYVARIAIQYGQANYLTLHNSNANKWRIYRTFHFDHDPTTPPPGISTAVLGFPAGELIGEIDIPGGAAITNFDDDGIIGFGVYPTITISVAGTTPIVIARDAEPPDWDTGDVFEDSLVVNDPANPSLIRYSFPGRPHSFPSLYFIGFNTKQQDVVTCIRSLDAVCVVGLRAQLWRVNYLPNETDSEFNRGRCRELISANHGIIGKDAACVFTPVEGSARIAYVSHDGLYMTDGLRTQLLTMDLDWDTLVNKTELPNCLLVNVQHLWSLFFYYTSAGGSAPNDRVLHLSYHPQHLKEGGMLKVSGPSTLSARAADYAANSFRAFASLTNVLEEDVTAGASTMTARTRLIYPQEGSLDTETFVDRIRILTGAFSGAGTFTTALIRRFSDADIVTDASEAFVPGTSQNRLITTELHGNAEAFGAQIVTQADAHYIAFEHRTTQ